MVDPLRIVFLGTPLFATPTLRALLASRHQVCGVITQPDRPRGRGQQVSDSPVKALAVELLRFGPPSNQTVLFGRKDSTGRAEQGRNLVDGAVPHSLRNAVRELKLRLGHSPLYRVVEVDPLSRIPERRHALLSFDP